MHDDATHPCGGLPIDQLSLTAFWCEHHMAWWARAELYRWTGDEDGPELTATRSIEFGPFDQADDVLEWLRKRAHDLAALRCSWGTAEASPPRSR
jgi:hypothetical protein